MRPNSKTYNTELGSSFQRGPYKTYQTKGKASTINRWDHGGFDQLQLEQHDKTSKPTMSKRDHQEKTLISDNLETSNRGRGLVIDKKKWVHDKCEENASANATPMDNKAIPTQTKERREKRPDRQLYSVRQKCTRRNEDVKNVKETTMQCLERLNCSVIEKKEEGSPSHQVAKDVLASFEDPFEDDKLSISNVSTAMSDRLKNWEEESYLKSELIKERAEMTPSPKGKESSDILFDILLESENGLVNVRVYQGEEDYEALLDKVCQLSNFDAKAGLYFKINILCQIKESGGEPEKVDLALDKLLDINYKLLMYESGYGEPEESIAPYIDQENKESDSALFETLEDYE